MHKSIYFVALILFCQPAFPQDWKAELLIGGAGYFGDLNENSFQWQTIRPAVNLNLKYRLGTQLYLRSGLAWGMTAGNDKYNLDSSLFLRNLSFQTTITEFNVGLEYLLFNPDIFDLSYPYVFAGVGVFRFNPSARDANDNKVFLQPLSTEGQGLPEYPNRKEYSRIQLCIPMGGGVTFAFSENLDLSAELGFRKLFFDYFDDVSTTYPNNTILSNRKGSTAAEMSYRGLYNHTQNSPPPPEGTIRGNPEKKDWYYFLGVKLSWYLGRGGS
jgi:hypothetical protein